MLNMEENLLRNKEYIIQKINLLLEYANQGVAHDLIKLKEGIKSIPKISLEQIKFYQQLENHLLEYLPLDERKYVLQKIKRLYSKYKRMDVDIEYTSDIIERLNSQERQINRLLERPRVYEMKAEEKLLEIDDKFRKLMRISDRNSSITDNIKKVDDLEKKLSKLENDAQNMMSDISTVELGKQYLEAKNRYCSPKTKMKFSRSKNKYIRYFANTHYWLLWIFKRIFNYGAFLYLGFFISLALLIPAYFVIVFKENATYKDMFLTIPMIWSAWFFQRKINIRDKLFELYNHKQKVMETYVAFKNSSYTFNAEDHMEEVLLEAIKKDPSDCIGKSNTTLVETILDKLRGLFVSGKVKKIMREDVIDDK